MNKKRVLVVEDDDFWVKRTLQTLHGLEINFRIATDWRQGMQALREGEPYDLFIFDNTLGEIHNASIDLIQTAWLLADPKDPPVLTIVHSADLPFAIQQKVEHLGAEYIQKTQDGTALRSAVERLLSLNTLTPSP